MGKIILYEEKNFLGNLYECHGGCPNLHSILMHCNSCKVESGLWMLYERPNYAGYQYFLRRGEYSDYQLWMGFNDCVRSCRNIPMHHGPHRMKVFEQAELKGHMMELTDDCPYLSERFPNNDVHSCNVTEGHWIFYEHPYYRGCQYLISPGNYQRFHEWGSMTARVGSIKRITMESTLMC